MIFSVFFYGLSSHSSSLRTALHSTTFCRFLSFIIVFYHQFSWKSWELTRRTMLPRCFTVEKCLIMERYLSVKVNACCFCFISDTFCRITRENSLIWCMIYVTTFSLGRLWLNFLHSLHYKANFLVFKCPFMVANFIIFITIGNESMYWVDFLQLQTHYVT